MGGHDLQRGCIARSKPQGSRLAARADPGGLRLAFGLGLLCLCFSACFWLDFGLIWFDFNLILIGFGFWLSFTWILLAFLLGFEFDLISC